MSLIRATYETAPAITSVAASKARGLETGTFQGEPQHVETGDAEAALAAAPHRIDVTYRTPRQNHNAIELHAATLAWKGEGNATTLSIHDASQAVAHMARREKPTKHSWAGETHALSRLMTRPDRCAA